MLILEGLGSIHNGYLYILILSSILSNYIFLFYPFFLPFLFPSLLPFNFYGWKINFARPNIHVCEISLEHPSVAINSIHWVRTRNIFSLKQFCLWCVGEQDQSPLYNSSYSIHIPSTQNITTPLSNRLLV